jgi:hypothetical protein
VRSKDVSDSGFTVSTGTAVNSRSGQAHFRGGANYPEGRFIKANFTFEGGFTTISGAEFTYTTTGKT